MRNLVIILSLVFSVLVGGGSGVEPSAGGGSGVEPVTGGGSGVEPLAKR